MADTNQGEASSATIGLVLLPRLGNSGIGVGVGNVRDLVLIPDLGLIGPRTQDDRPALVKAEGVDAGEAAGDDAQTKLVGLDIWFENVHILPREELEFGNITTQDERTFEIYSAFRNDTISLDSVTNNTIPGTSLPDLPDTPFDVPPQSSILRSSTDNCGDDFELGENSLQRVQVSSDGLPTFDDSIDFDFIGGNDVSLFLSGSRIVLLPYEYEVGVRETLSFGIDILESVGGYEQRIDYRSHPRQIFRLRYDLDGDERREIMPIIFDWAPNTFALPLWHETVKTTAATAVNATEFPVRGADDVEFRVGGLAAVISDSLTFDVLQVTAVSDTLVTCSNPVVNAYPAGTPLMPVRSGIITSAIAGRRAFASQEDIQFDFQSTDNSTGALEGSTTPGFWSLFNSRVLFDDCNFIASGMSEAYTRQAFRIDNGTGKPTQESIWDRGKKRSTKGFVLRDRSEIMQFRELMIALRGSQKAFYMPSFIEDLNVVVDLGIGTDTMDISSISYTRFAQDRLPFTLFRITFTDGTSLEREIISSAAVSTTVDRLTLDDNWPDARTTDEIERIEFFDLVRFDTSDIQIEYPRIGLARCTAPVIRVFDDN